MRKTFKELAENEHFTTSFEDSFNKVIDFEDVIKLMKLVREKTIEECIEKGYGLYYESVFDKNPTYVNVEDKSLEKLDKESIEV